MATAPSLLQIKISASGSHHRHRPRFISLLKHCSKTQFLSYGRILHDLLLRSHDDDRDHILRNLLIDMYASCGRLREAQSVFDSLRHPNVYSWNVLLHGYGKHGSLAEARAVFDRIPHPDVCSWNTLIKLLSRHGGLEETRSLFGRMPHRNVVTWNAMISAALQDSSSHDAPQRNVVAWSAASCSSCRDAPHRNVVTWNAATCNSCHDAPHRNVVTWSAATCNSCHDAPHRNVVTWNAAACNSCHDDALHLFTRMICEGIRPDRFTFVSIVDACTRIVSLRTGKIIHALVLGAGCEGDLLVGTALINMYGKCGNSALASAVFGRMPCPDDVAWTAFMASFSHNDLGTEALDVFYAMLRRGIEADVVTYVCALDACSSLRLLDQGREMHSALVELRSEEKNSVIRSALANLYGKCGSLSDARSVFGNVSLHPDRRGRICQDAVTWTVMICSHSQNGENREALQLFCQMMCEGIEADEVAFICALDACANTASLDGGQAVYGAILETVSAADDTVIGNNLVNMFGKCGCPIESKRVFDRISEKSLLSWNAMLGAFALNGCFAEAVLLFGSMQIEGIKADDVTYLGLLGACSHGGHVQHGSLAFLSVSQCHGIVYTMDHYVCVVDLLGRAGRLEEAELFIRSIPSLSDLPMAWLCLLGASRTHGDLDRGIRAARCSVDLDPNDPAPCVALLNFYSEMGEMEYT